MNAFEKKKIPLKTPNITIPNKHKSSSKTNDQLNETKIVS